MRKVESASIVLYDVTDDANGGGTTIQSGSAKNNLLKNAAGKPSVKKVRLLLTTRSPSPAAITCLLDANEDKHDGIGWWNTEIAPTGKHSGLTLFNLDVAHTDANDVRKEGT